MPPIKVNFRRALAGGSIAAILWEIVRNIMVWYFDNLSLVNVVYGSLGTVIIVLLSMEVAAVIILLGAQVIAELERSAQLDLPWYMDADRPLHLDDEPFDQDPLEGLVHQDDPPAKLKL